MSNKKDDSTELTESKEGVFKLTLTKTDRNFNVFEFKDSCDQKCSLQKSSLAEIDTIWLGVDEDTDRDIKPSRMLLSKNHAKVLIPIFQKFVDTGKVADYDFTEHYQSTCTIRQSIECLKIGMDSTPVTASGMEKMYLNQKQVKALIPVFQLFVNTGNIKIGKFRHIVGGANGSPLRFADSGEII